MGWKKEVIDNTPIEFDKELETIEILTKKRAHTFIAFQYEKGRDKHFIDMNYVNLKHNNITNSNFIISTDYDQWVNHMKRQGWESHKNIPGFLETRKNKSENTDG